MHIIACNRVSRLPKRLDCLIECATEIAITTEIAAQFLRIALILAQLRAELSIIYAARRTTTTRELRALRARITFISPRSLRAAA